MGYKTLIKYLESLGGYLSVPSFFVPVAVMNILNLIAHLD